MALLSKTEPISVNYGVGLKKQDAEGRLITAEYPNFYLVTSYVPNAGRKLVTLDKRMEWDPALRKHMKELDEKKPVILCGDLNVAHKEIDLANPKTNKKSAGFTIEERDGKKLKSNLSDLSFRSFKICYIFYDFLGFTKLLDEGFVDSYRHFYPDKEKSFTFWTYMMNARGKNVGWRLDYFVASKRFMDENVCDCVIRDKIFGSDHCPSVLLINN